MIVCDLVQPRPPAGTLDVSLSVIIIRCDEPGLGYASIIRI